MSLPPDIERLALLGWKLFPASRSSRAAMFEGAHLRATDDLNQLARWAREYQKCNWKVVFGPSGLWGFDLDRPGHGHAHDGVAAMGELVRIHGPLGPGPRARSGGGGVLLFWRHQGERIVGEGNQPMPGMDPRRGRQTQTIPPSIHIATREPYRWLIPPWEQPPTIAPAWLLRLVEPPPEAAYRPPSIATDDQARRAMFRATMAVMEAPGGGRNDTLNRRAYQLGRLIGRGLLDEREAAEHLYGAARHAGLDHDEIRNTIRSGFQSGRRAADG